MIAVSFWNRSPLDAGSLSLAVEVDDHSSYSIFLPAPKGSDSQWVKRDDSRLDISVPHHLPALDYYSSVPVVK